ncbi:hypothetical protein DMN91_007162 [Ooceraea biroi]|uniref:Uncharacterized protein n=1 Tax=Ooceraea biroi TaxID=2015173 RepID=A0A026WNJ0_OOCBI|nr:uncharacterized protein LOC113562250 [Ooceraea biroi]EZA57231.1 hypothetical protein X777_01837 [Ooceraea biroi]RLU20551.1 hypothetical protein DMN91_007162 [Ooceraea biroi]
MAVGGGISIVCLVTRVCLASAILTAKVSLDPTNLSRPWHSYPSTLSAPRHPNHQYDNHATDSNVRELSPKRLQAERPARLLSASVVDINEQTLQRGPQRFPVEIHPDDVWLSAKMPNVSPSPPPLTTTTTTTTTTTLSGPRSIRGYQRYVPRYQDIKVFDGYLTADLDAGKSPYRGKAESYYRHGPQDITAVIRALDRFLSRTLNNDGYNSELHPPPNPILALVLSRYGRYVPGKRYPRVYAYMAVNNIHNSQPFGKYKYECDEEPIYAAR